jgi:hypothetical protein
MAENRSPAPLAAARASKALSSADQRSEHIPNRHHFQARFIARRFDVSSTIAGVVAELAFGASR